MWHGQHESRTSSVESRFVTEGSANSPRGWHGRVDFGYDGAQRWATSWFENADKYCAIMRKPVGQTQDFVNDEDTKSSKRRTVQLVQVIKYTAARYSSKGYVFKESRLY